MTTPDAPEAPEREMIAGLGETMRGIRYYIGLEADQFAERLDISKHSYLRIERDARPCPAGLFADAQELVDMFDDNVETVRNSWYDIDEENHIVFTDSGTSHDDWMRAVILRANVLENFPVRPKRRDRA